MQIRAIADAPVASERDAARCLGEFRRAERTQLLREQCLEAARTGGEEGFGHG